MFNFNYLYILFFLNVLKYFLKQKTKPSATNVIASSHDKNSPEYFLKKILDKTINTKDMNSLSVSLRTLTLKCVEV